ncbi:hypothetical protein [Riemerella anatipestifer]|uniref:Uncharacterized protein n=2 Tax=Riemerella anatipestifer TaxID=34085 RepID=A0A161P356_RIEAN|nr:hypothetical protein [Riemerella anatipestifer]ADZ13106.1 conserved hypothetical protein [Riemerella anatipestifer RA-GD]AGC40706.1 hypothetical protein G148_1402 [Riemerella anatipestifer RA-CH-2]AKP68679.1 hypothetical protein CG08_0243 [Riemerella anatipestifer]AKP70523.1 hypothetical protein CG09_0235 [Riemerella anatipestifer]AKQ38955.1 hypothetical protein AS87_01090 [Riemerella anatipestifer Yb2]
MRLSNKVRTPYYQFIFTLANITLLVGLIFFILQNKVAKLFTIPIDIGIIAFAILLYLIFYIRGRQIFEYDSDGEALNFQNRNIIDSLGKNAKDEFPKYKLDSYEIVDVFLFRRLYIRLKNKKGSLTVLKYDISYLNSKEIKDLKLSLNRTIKSNQENSNNRDIN